MAWGFGTWDANGKPNNYGLVPVSIVGYVELSNGQVSGSFNYTVPAGYRLDYIHIPKLISYTTIRRTITISGGNVAIGQAASSNYGFGSEMAYNAFLLVYLRND